VRSSRIVGAVQPACLANGEQYRRYNPADTTFADSKKTLIGSYKLCTLLNVSGFFSHRRSRSNREARLTAINAAATTIADSKKR